MKFYQKLIILFSIVIILTSIIYAEEIVVYRVKRGDNLTSIAKYYQVNLERLIKYNQLKNPDIIRIGQQIKIPNNNSKYVIKKGDFLCSIADKLKVSLKRLIEINNIKNPDIIYIGQELVLPLAQTRTDYVLASRNNTVQYIWPIQGEISSEYGWRKHPVRERREFHTGIDIAVSIGSPVYAAEDGVITFSGWSGGYGNLIIIRHRDNSKTYYGHNIELLVKKGEIIKKGKVIALSGSTGVSTGPHLHFEIRINNRHCNPLNYLNKGYLNNGFRV